MPEVRLQGAGVVTLRWPERSRRRGAACGRGQERVACTISRFTAADVKGPPRSVAKTKAELGNWRRSSRRALISSPRSGWTLGLPFFTRRTCSDERLLGRLPVCYCGDAGSPGRMSVYCGALSALGCTMRRDRFKSTAFLVVVTVAVCSGCGSVRAQQPDATKFNQTYESAVAKAREYCTRYGLTTRLIPFGTKCH